MANELSKVKGRDAQMVEHKPLTAKMEQFAQAIVSGANQTNAYRAAYSASGMTAQTVWVKAAKLAGQDKVRIRIATLQADLADKRLWTRARSVEALIEAFDTASAKGNPAGMTGAIKELNAMHGYDAPKKLDLNVAAAARTITPDMTPQQAAEAYAAMLDPKNG